MEDFIKNTIKKIKTQQIAPQPRWKYLVKKYSSWVALVSLIIFGGLSLSVAGATVSSLDWDLYRFVHQSFFSYALSIFPYFWAILIGIFLLVAVFDIRKTETGYRFSWLKIALIVVGGVIFLGLAASFIGIGGRFNSMLSAGVPYYGEHMMVTKESQWMNPEKGFLAGTIVLSSESNLQFADLNGKGWNVSLNKETLIRPMANMSQGQMIKIIGIKTDSSNFIAIEVRPWMGSGMGAGQRNGMGPGGGGLRGN